jgi:hypothetical protein
MTRDLVKIANQLDRRGLIGEANFLDGIIKNSEPIDWLQGGLDVAGLVPGYGEVADGINAIISTHRNDPIGATLSVVSMIPMAGDVVGKGIKGLLAVLSMTTNATHMSHDIVDAAKGIERRLSSNGVGRVVEDTLKKVDTATGGSTNFASVWRDDIIPKINEAAKTTIAPVA